MRNMKWVFFAACLIACLFSAQVFADDQLLTT